jgi:hypothetical protein
MLARLRKLYFMVKKELKTCLLDIKVSRSLRLVLKITSKATIHWLNLNNYSIEIKKAALNVLAYLT